MGNRSNGVRSESLKVVARCPGRNNFPEVQSLNARPCLRRGSRRLGIAKAPKAKTGATFSSSRRFIFLNFRSSIPRGSASGRYTTRFRTKPLVGFGAYGKVTGFQGVFLAGNRLAGRVTQKPRLASNGVTADSLGTVTRAKIRDCRGIGSEDGYGTGD